MATNNAILVYAEGGAVTHRFLPEVEARQFLVEAQQRLDGASMLALEGEIDAELMLKISPDLRDRLEQAETRLKADIRFRTALDRNGVPRESVLRQAIHKAFSELALA